MVCLILNVTLYYITLQFLKWPKKKETARTTVARIGNRLQNNETSVFSVFVRTLACWGSSNSIQKIVLESRNQLKQMSIPRWLQGLVDWPRVDWLTMTEDDYEMECQRCVSVVCFCVILLASNLCRPWEIFHFLVGWCKSSLNQAVVSLASSW